MGLEFIKGDFDFPALPVKGGQLFKETLALFERADDPNPHTELLNGNFALRLQSTRLEDVPQKISTLRYELLGLDMVYLDFAGRKPKDHEIHRSLADLHPGSQLTASITATGQVEFSAPSGIAVARLASSARASWSNRIEKISQANVVALVKRSIGDVATEYSENYLCDEWEVPVIEIHWK